MRGEETRGERREERRVEGAERGDVKPSKIMIHWDHCGISCACCPT